MGWASYLEDIIERLTDDLRVVDAVLADPKISDNSKQTTLLEWHGRAQKTLLEMTRNMDLASDPDVDLAAEVFDLERRRKSLILENATLASSKANIEREVSMLKNTLAQLENKVGELRGALKAEKKRNIKLQDAIQADPTNLYEKYTSPDRLKRLHKDDD